MNRLSVLYVGDEDDVVELVPYLSEQAIDLRLAGRDDAAIKTILRVDPDVVIVDIGPPGRAGLELCSSVRQRSRVPIISTSAIARDSVGGLEAGADDFIAKPLPRRELIARIRSRVRRARGAWGLFLDLGPLQLDPLSLVVRIDGTPVALTTTEFECLHALARHPGVTLSREHLLQTIYGSKPQKVRSIDVIVSRLRQKLGDDRRRQRWIRAVRNVGYALTLSEQLATKAFVRER